MENERIDKALTDIVQALPLARHPGIEFVVFIWDGTTGGGAYSVGFDSKCAIAAMMRFAEHFGLPFQKTEQDLVIGTKAI